MSEPVATCLLRERALAALPDATVVARAPGRANLIGEHTDYNGFPVLPFAIDRAAWTAAAPRASATLTVRNLDAVRFPQETIPLAHLMDRPRQGTWVDYVVAAARLRPPAQGLELVVGGDVPLDAGLSSSAALLCSVLLALAEPGDRLALAEAARLAEQYVGTLAGGMDQAAALLGRRDHALRIDFRPLRVRTIALPPALAVVVAHSGVSAAKGGAAQAGYNARVRECAAAAHLLGAPAGGLLADVPGEDRLERARRLADPILRTRAGFVFAEAERVGSAEEALEDGDLASLGKLLDASHQGLRDLYEVSHPAVDALVARARAAGAFGARIVGAGFGGCMIALADAQRAGAVQQALGAQAWILHAADGASRTVLR